MPSREPGYVPGRLLRWRLERRERRAKRSYLGSAFEAILGLLGSLLFLTLAWWGLLEGHVYVPGRRGNGFVVGAPWVYPFAVLLFAMGKTLVEPLADHLSNHHGLHERDGWMPIAVWFVAVLAIVTIYGDTLAKLPLFPRS